MRYPWALLGVNLWAGLVLALAWRLSPWFLALFLVPLPPSDNWMRWVLGLVRPLFGGSRYVVELDLEGGRVGADFRGHGMEFVPYADIRLLERFGDTWCLLFDRHSLDIPMDLLPPEALERMRREMTPEA